MSQEETQKQVATGSVATTRFGYVGPDAPATPEPDGELPGGNFDLAGNKEFTRKWHQLWVDLAKA